MTPTPIQYVDAKKAAGNAVLLFRVGDFYEAFHQDARAIACTLGLALTSSGKGENAVPMAGFLHHHLEPYLQKLVASGHRVAVCDQVQNAPKGAKVERIVVGDPLIDSA